MSTKHVLRATFILTLIGMVVSAQQVSSDSVFDAKDRVNFEKLRVTQLSLAATVSPGGEAASLGYRVLRGDTVETFDVEVEEEKGPGIARQLVIFAIITAAVGYAVIVLMKSDDSEKEKEPSGKEPPTVARGALISAPFPRLR
jgi:hypothetical protein